MQNTVHPVAKQQWDDAQGCQDLLRHWQDSPDKHEAEALIGDMAGRCAARIGRLLEVADLGCGPGRLVDSLSPYISKYAGYDLSVDMLVAAREKYVSDKRCRFVSRDFLLGAPTKKPADLLLSIDTSRHYSDPMALLVDMQRLWPAREYLFSVLHGEDRVELLNGLCISHSEFHDRLADLGTLVERMDQVREDFGMTVSYVQVRRA